MCLAVRMRIKSVDGFAAVCEAKGIEGEASLSMLQGEEGPAGYPALVHGGYAIQKVSQEEARLFGFPVTRHPLELVPSEQHQGPRRQHLSALDGYATGGGVARSGGPPAARSGASTDGGAQRQDPAACT